MFYGRKSGSGSRMIMMAAFTLLTFYMACAFPVIRMPMYFGCSIFIIGAMEEGSIAGALITFGATLAFGFLMLNNKALIMPYLVFFGYYGILKSFIERMHTKAWPYIIKFLFFNGALFAMYSLNQELVLSFAPPMSAYLFVILFNLIFLAYDFLFMLFKLFYRRKINRGPGIA